MVSKAFILLSLLAGQLGLSQAGGHPLFTGNGYIHVLNTTDSDFAHPDPSRILGCMSETGQLTRDDCGVFNHDANGILTSAQGNCTFSDNAQEANTDAIYGQRNYAWACGAGLSGWYYYAFDTIELPIIFQGNLDGYQDVKDIPSKADDAFPVWAFVWGSDQVDVPPGHTKTIWQWKPVTSSEAVPGGST